MASNHQLPAGKAEHALALIRERYTDFGPTLACEKLHESHGIEMSVETVRTLMIAAGLWIPRSQRAPKVYQPRDRRACTGELVQIDGGEHAWFEDRAPACTLLVYVDDATSRLMVLHFTVTESTFSCFEATRAYLERATASRSRSTATARACSGRCTAAPAHAVSRSLAARCTSSISRYGVRTAVQPRAASSAPTSRCRTAW